MGEVFRATDTRLHRGVAIKISHEKFSARFEREAQTISALNHPNICTLYDVGASPAGVGYLVMELVEGETLAPVSNAASSPSTTRSVMASRSPTRWPPRMPKGSRIAT